MPATCVAWNDASRSIGNRPGATRVRPGKRSRDDHLRRRPLPAALGEARRVGVTGGIQERVRAVDAVVDDADLDPVALRACERLQLGCTDHRRAGVGGEVVADAGIDLLDEAEARQRRELRYRQRDREAVEHDLVAPADSRRRDRAQEPCRRDTLGGGKLGEIAARGSGRHVQPSFAAVRRQPSALRGRKGRERQADDHADAAGGLVPRNAERARPNAGKVQFAEVAVDRDKSRTGGNDPRERRRDRKETHRTAQGSAI